MLFDTFLDLAVEEIARSFPNAPVCARYIGQFDLQADDKTTYRAPALFTGFVSASAHTDQNAIYDMDMLIATVIISDLLDRKKRESQGTIMVETLLQALDNLPSICSQANVPVIQSINKVERNSPESNAGYSYWTVLYQLPWRWDRVLPLNY